MATMEIFNKHLKSFSTMVALQFFAAMVVPPLSSPIFRQGKFAAFALADL